MLPRPLLGSFECALWPVVYELLKAEKQGGDIGQLAAVFE